MSDAIAIVSLVVSAVLAFLGALTRYTVARQDLERERRFQDVEQDVDRLRAQQHTLEVSVVRNEGQLSVLRSEHTAAEAVLAGLREDMIGRREWEARMNGFEEGLRGIRDQLQSVTRLMQAEGPRATTARGAE